MSVLKIRSLASAIITEASSKKIIASAQDGGKIDADERAELDALAAAPADRFESPAARQSFLASYSAATGAPLPPTPRVFTQESRPSWTTTYFPMADYSGDKKGSPESNLWAEHGAADEFDKVLSARHLTPGAREFELQPAINWIVGKPSGGYLANGTVDEKNAEVTTGLDLNGDGKITPNVEWDVIGYNGTLVRANSVGNGKAEDSVGVSWWGHCDEVGAAGIMFREPVKDVEIDGAKFTPVMIKGLLSMISQSQGGNTEYVGSRNNEEFDSVHLKNGEQFLGRVAGELKFGSGTRFNYDDATFNGGFAPELQVVLKDGTTRTVKGSEVDSITRELRKESPAMYHTKMIDWLASGRPAVMDKDDGLHLWNYNFHKLEDTMFEKGQKPDWADQVDLTNGFSGPVQPGDDVTYVDRKVTLGASGAGESGGQESYQYWIAKRNGEIVNSGWASGSSSPDFLWRPTQAPIFSGPNPRNPFIKPEIVKEIYLRSLSDADRAAEEQRLAAVVQ